VLLETFHMLVFNTVPTASVVISILLDLPQQLVLQLVVCEREEIQINMAVEVILIQYTGLLLTKLKTILAVLGLATWNTLRPL